MKLTHYKVKIELSDPDDDSVTMVVTLPRVERGKLISTPIPLNDTLEQFESAMDSVPEIRGNGGPTKRG